MGDLSKHFSLRLKDGTPELACRCGCTPTAETLEALRKTAEFLERVRTYLGDRPITVNSGYRCRRRNTAVGGASNSQHLRGTAADITVAGLTPRQVQIRLEAENSPVANHGLGRYKNFTHVDRRGVRARWDG